MTKDVSNKTIVILIILLLIVSLAGFWIISGKIDAIKLYPLPLVDKDAALEGPGSDDVGAISLKIENDKDPTVGETTGMISLTILN